MKRKRNESDPVDESANPNPEHFAFDESASEERTERSKKKGKKTKKEKRESEPDEAAKSSEHSASKERIERSKKRAKKAKKDQRGFEPDEVAESSHASKVRSERSKKKRKKAKKEKKESEPVEKKERDEAVESSKEHEKSSKKKKKKEKERRRKERRAAKSKTRNLVKVLVSSGKYPESLFSQNKEMLHDMVLAIYWGPACPNSLCELLREWFIHGGWPWKSSKKEPSDCGTPFKRSFNIRNFNERLRQDMDRYWPETMKRFWKHEWQTHGRDSGMSAEEYFSTILDIYHAIMAHGINLQCGVSMQAHQAIARIEQTLGRVQMSAFRLEDATEVNTELYIRELKIHIDRKSYGIVSSSEKQRYLGQITKADNLVVLPVDPVRLCKLAEQ